MRSIRGPADPTEEDIKSMTDQLFERTTTGLDRGQKLIGNEYGMSVFKELHQKLDSITKQLESHEEELRAHREMIFPVVDDLLMVGMTLSDHWSQRKIPSNLRSERYRVRRKCSWRHPGHQAHVPDESSQSGNLARNFYQDVRAALFGLRRTHSVWFERAPRDPRHRRQR